MENLEPISETPTIFRYLKYAYDFKEPVSLLVESTGQRIDGVTVTKVEPSLLAGFEIPAPFFAPLTEAQKESFSEPEQISRLSFSTNEVEFFAKGKFQKRNVREIFLQISSPIYKLQRRDAIRMKAPKGMASIEIDGTVFEIEDISASGLSILVSADQLQKFPIRSTLISCTLKFSELNLKVNLDVMNHLKRKDQDISILKVGFRFISLPQKAEQKIAREAMLYSQKLWKQWI